MIIAINNNDIVAAERHAHTIKGSALNIEAYSLSKTAYKIERACKERKSESAKLLVEQLKKDFKNVESFLKTHK